MHIAFVNETKKYRNKVTNDAVSKMAQCFHSQLRYDVAPVWEIDAPSVIFYVDKAHVPAGSHIITFLDSGDEPGVGGWHTNDSKGLYGVVYAGAALDNGGAVLTGPWSVAELASHETVEMALDRFCNLYASDWRGKIVSTEACDPGEGHVYNKVGAWGTISCADFIYPAWTDPQGRGGKFDHVGAIKAPFTIGPGGYLVWSQEGKTQQTFGAEMPQWRKEAKEAEFLGSRTAARKQQLSS